MAHLCYAQNLRTDKNISSLSRRTNSHIFNLRTNTIFEIKVVNKIAPSSALNWQSAFCFMLIYEQLTLLAERAQTKASLTYLTSWHNCIFGLN